MELTWGSITSQEQWYTVEQRLFTYNEDEQIENRINKEQAELILKPKFIPLYTFMLHEWFSLIEATLFWFIDFFLSNNDRFYCTNEQLAEMLNVSENTISTAIKSLKDRWLLEISYKMRGWWGKIRFIHLATPKNCEYDTQNLGVATPKKHSNIYNKYIDNNIIYKFDDFWSDYPHARKWKKADSEKYFLKQNPQDVKKQVAILKWRIESWIVDSQYIPACERWIRDFTPLSDTIIKQDIKQILKRHLKADWDKNKRFEKLKQDFPDVDFNEMLKEINRDKWLIKMSFN